MSPYVVPILLGACWKLLPSLDQEDTGVTDLPTAHLPQPADTQRQQARYRGEEE